jgi:hypothetical protein
MKVPAEVKLVLKQVPKVEKAKVSGDFHMLDHYYMVSEDRFDSLPSSASS